MDMAQLGTKIRLIREKLDLTQEQVAAEAKMNTRSLQRLEEGRGNPTLSTIYGLSKALSTPAHELIADPSTSFRPDIKNAEKLPDFVPSSSPDGFWSDLKSFTNAISSFDALTLMSMYLGTTKHLGNKIEDLKKTVEAYKKNPLLISYESASADIREDVNILLGLSGFDKDKKSVARLDVGFPRVDSAEIQNFLHRISNLSPLHWKVVLALAYSEPAGAPAHVSDRLQSLLKAL